MAYSTNNLLPPDKQVACQAWKGGEFLNKDNQGMSLEDDKSPNQVAPKSAMVPPTQPLPKKEDEIRANTAKNIGSTQDSDPTLWFTSTEVNELV